MAAHRAHAPPRACPAAASLIPCQCFLTWLERELERQGERAASPGWSVSCNVCKEPYRLRRARKPARVLCYTLGERLFTGLFFASFLVGCLIVGYIMVSLTALLSGHDAAYDVLVGGDESIFRAAEITLLFAFVVGSSAIVLTFLWHSFSPCSAPLPEQRDVATLFDLKALDRLTVDYGARSSPWWLRGGLGRAAAAAPARKFGARWSRSAEVHPAAEGAGPALAEGGEPGTAAHQVPRGPHAMQWGFARERAPAPPPV